MLKKPSVFRTRDGQAKRDRRDVQALILPIALFPPVSHVLRVAACG